jgi:hypothetical protein
MFSDREFVRNQSERSRYGVSGRNPTAFFGSKLYSGRVSGKTSGFFWGMTLLVEWWDSCNSGMVSPCKFFSPTVDGLHPTDAAMFSFPLKSKWNRQSIGSLGRQGHEIHF